MRIASATIDANALCIIIVIVRDRVFCRHKQCERWCGSQMLRLNHSYSIFVHKLIANIVSQRYARTFWWALFILKGK